MGKCPGQAKFEGYLPNGQGGIQIFFEPCNDHLQSTESSKNCSKANEDKVLGELSKLYKSEGTVNDPINAKLASLVDKMVKTSLSEEKIKEKHEKYNRPENCENLINTSVNPEIWSKPGQKSGARSGQILDLKT